MAQHRQLPTVATGLYRVAELLQDERIWGLPEQNCVVVHQPENSETVVAALREAAEGAPDTMVFYYAGHGLVDPMLAGGDLHLSLPQAYEPGGMHLALSYSYVRREFALARALHRVAILDCCWSGRAVTGMMGSDVIAEATEIDGTAVLTATTATRKAQAPPAEPYPAFTGALIELLSRGVSGGPRLLDLDTIYRHLTRHQRRAGRPLPQFHSGGAGARIVLARNLAWRESASELAAADPHSTADPSSSIARLRRLGRYGEAADLQQRAAEIGQQNAVQSRLIELRRSGRYMDALELDRIEIGPNTDYDVTFDITKRPNSGENSL